MTEKNNIRERILQMSWDISDYCAGSEKGFSIEDVLRIARKTRRLARYIGDKENEFWLSIELTGRTSVNQNDADRTKEQTEYHEEFHKAQLKWNRVHNVRDSLRESMFFEEINIPEGEDSAYEVLFESELNELVRCTLMELYKELERCKVTVNDYNIAINSYENQLALLKPDYITNIFSNVRAIVCEFAENVWTDYAKLEAASEESVREMVTKEVADLELKYNRYLLVNPIYWVEKSIKGLSAVVILIINNKPLRTAFITIIFLLAAMCTIFGFNIWDFREWVIETLAALF